jgi:hypothetical protein
MTQTMTLASSDVIPAENLVPMAIEVLLLQGYEIRKGDAVIVSTGKRTWTWEKVKQ